MALDSTTDIPQGAARASPRVWSRAVPCLLRWMDRHGIDTPTVLQQLEINPAVRDDANATLNIQQFIMLWEAAAKVEPAIGLILAAEVDEDDLHLINQILRRSRTLREALQNGTRYGKLVSSIYTATLTEDRSQGFYIFDPTNPAWESRHVTDYHLASMVRLAMQETGGAFRITSLAFAHSDPGYSALYRATFGADPVFDQPDTRIGFATTMLDLPMASYSPHINDILLAHAEALLSEIDTEKTFATRVRAAAARRLADGHIPSLSHIADDLHISVNVLQRRLRREGLPWRRLLEESRRDLVAKRLKSGVRVADIAAALGYSEPAALHHAIRRWFGMSATEFRSNAENRSGLHS